MVKSNRISYLRKDFNNRLPKLIRKGKLVETDDGNIYDPAFKNFIKLKKQNEDLNNLDIARSVQLDITEYDIWALFDFLFGLDNTNNKEYLHWLINLYIKQTRERYPLDHEKYNKSGDEFGGHRFSFFEDAIQLYDEFEEYNYLKKTNILSIEERDINKFQSIGEFRIIFKDLSSEDGVITPQEYDLIRNGEAEILVNDETHYLVNLLTVRSGQLFGKKSTWCTASNTNSRFNNMFNHYKKDGNIYVLIDKKPKKHNSDRIQIHFNSGQVMALNNVNDSRTFKTIMHNNTEINKVLISDYYKFINGVHFSDSITNLRDFGFDVYDFNLSELIRVINFVDITLDSNKFNDLENQIPDIIKVGSIRNLTLLNCKNIDVKLGADSSIESLSIHNASNLSLVCGKSVKKLAIVDSNVKHLKYVNESLNILKFKDIDVKGIELNLKGATNLNILDIDNVNFGGLKNLNDCKSLNFLFLQKMKISLNPNELSDIGDTLLRVIFSEGMMTNQLAININKIKKRKQFGFLVIK